MAMSQTHAEKGDATQDQTTERLKVKRMQSTVTLAENYY